VTMPDPYTPGKYYDPHDPDGRRYTQPQPRVPGRQQRKRDSSGIKMRGKKVTAARTDRAITAIAGILECDDFDSYDQAAGGQLSSALNQTADLLRDVRDKSSGRTSPRRRKW
jgi:hypothetical protein